MTVLVWAAFGSISAQSSIVDSAQEMQKRETFERLIETAQRPGSVRVIIGLNLDVEPVGNLRQAQFNEQRNDIKDAQENFLNRYQTSLQRGVNDNVKLFDYIPFLAFEIDAAMLEQMRNDGQITSLEEDVAEAPTLLESTNIVGAPAAWAAGFDGNGWAVAVLDTGVMKTHNFLSNKVVSEACFSQTVEGNSTSVCPGGVSESTNFGLHRVQS